jgi:DNA methylase
MSFQITTGDCREIMRGLCNDSIDSIVTDPPYGLGFMGKGWDHAVPGVEFWQEMLRVAKPGAYLLAFGGSRTFHRMACAIEDAGWEIRDTIMWLYGSGFPKSHNGPWGGTALKPAHEPIVMGRKPLTGTVAANVLTYGTGGLNIDLCRVEGAPRTTHADGNFRTKNGGNTMNEGFGVGEYPAAAGRWPANLIHDGGEEVLSSFPQVMGHGSAARFFYCAKASKRDRDDGLDDFARVKVKTKSGGGTPNNGRTAASDGGVRANFHPTVKPTDLMRYLVRLVTPPGGLVLDPFMGSGSTGRGALLEGFRFIGIEQDADYTAIAHRRIQAIAMRKAA